MAANDDAIRFISALHAAVDTAAKPVEDANRARLRCSSGCADCCTDDLTVFEIEADLIRHHHAELLANHTPHAPGACAFLDEHNACRIYAHRPYVCRTQGLPLRWLEEDEDTEEIFESRDICPLNLDEGTSAPLEELAADHCWSIGPFEERLADRQASIRTEPDGRPARVALRSLFASAPTTNARRLPIVK